MRRFLIAAVIVGVLAVVYLTPVLRRPAPAPSPAAPTTRAFEIPSWGNGAPTLVLDLPAAAKMEHRQGPDFDVTYFTLPSRARLGIYMGHHPNPSRPATAESLKATVGEVPVTWFCWQGTADGAAEYTCETVVEGMFRNPRRAPAQSIPLPPGKPQAPGPPPPPSGVESLVLHIWATGDRAAVEALRGYAAGLRLGR